MQLSPNVSVKRGHWGHLPHCRCEITASFGLNQAFQSNWPLLSLWRRPEVPKLAFVLCKLHVTDISSNSQLVDCLTDGPHDLWTTRRTSQRTEYTTGGLTDGLYCLCTLCQVDFSKRTTPLCIVHPMNTLIILTPMKPFIQITMLACKHFYQFSCKKAFPPSCLWECL